MSEQLDSEDMEIMSDYRELMHQKKEIEGKIEEVKPYVMEIMEDFELKNYELGDMKVSYVTESTSQQFDTAKFKKDNPNLVEQYQKEQVKKAHVKAKLG